MSLKFVHTEIHMSENVFAPKRQVAVKSKTKTLPIFAPLFKYPKYTSLETIPIFDVSSTSFCSLSSILAFEFSSEKRYHLINENSLTLDEHEKLK